MPHLYVVAFAQCSGLVVPYCPVMPRDNLIEANYIRGRRREPNVRRVSVLNPERAHEPLFHRTFDAVTLQSNCSIALL